MHVLCTALPYASHLRCVVPFGQALLAAGHRVSVAVPSFMHRYLAPCGFDLIDIDSDGVPPVGRPAAGTAERFTALLVSHNTKEYVRVAEHLSPDLVLRGDADFGGYLAAELLGLPHACVAGGLANTVDPGWLLPRLDAHRSRLGLPPDPTGDALYRYAYLDYMPPSFGFTRRPIPRTGCYRLPLPDHPGETVPPWMAELPTDRPLVLAAAGSSTHPNAARLAHITVLALAELECSAVVVTDAGNGASDIAPPHVRVVDYAPQSLLLSTCSLFVSHGGLNSIRESMQCAVPLVLTPLFGDQPYNAERCAAYGLGVVVEPAVAAADELREACRQVLDGPGFARRARAAQRAFLGLPDAHAAVGDLVELTGSQDR